jgi:cob(I)alamin adenosyltransferase
MTNKALVHVYTGHSKGKTTAAFGLALRALGSGVSVLVIQFLKGGGKLSGEAEVFGKLPGAKLVCFADQRHPLFSGETDVEALKKSIAEGFEYARSEVNSGRYGLVVLDEINNCMKEGWLAPERVAELIKERPDSVELVLTGRSCPREIMELADYVTDMHLVKHPAESGVAARRGVEF